ncbi:scamp family-domain-containing protein [Boletus reticuloceps]|uniref:Scamp family-domain-containing protein n=1 Tax=Boletus reticuloceps TaxID=495285 RepID=A0A8I3A908_9AGAM|nr:scamp family-domain-containing protein [Boletus reticuloceps]
MSEFTQNPFASTHSLDTNPFDDPAPKDNPRFQNIDRRERDLERREQELNQREEHIRTHGRSNWPPFYPLIYHSISEEIPDASRPLITRLYQLWLVLLATLLVNMLACIFVLVAGASDGGKDLGGSIGYLFIIPPLSFLLWYRPIYNGYMKEQALYYYMYFFFGGFHLLFSVYMIIGIPSTGSAGLIQTIQMFSQGHLVAGILGAFATAGWTLQGVGSAFYYRQVCRVSAVIPTDD